MAQRAGARALGVRGVPGAQASHALVVLGQVDELKPPGERAHQHLGLIQREAGHELGQPIGGSLVPEARLLTEGDGIVEQTQGVGPAAHGDDLAQDVREQSLVGGEVPASGGEAHRRRCSQNGKGRPAPGGPHDYDSVSPSAGNPTANSNSRYS